MLLNDLLEDYTKLIDIAGKAETRIYLNNLVSTQEAKSSVAMILTRQN